MKDESGQTLVELATALPVLAFAVAGTLWILRAGALRAECTRVVFETVRSEIEMDRVPISGPRPNGVRIQVTADGVKGELRCGSHYERIFLPYLGRRSAGA